MIAGSGGRTAGARAGRDAVQVLALTVALFLALLVPSVTARAGAASAPGTVTATYAEQPGARPDFIFPLMSTRYFGPTNGVDFQYLMYRPLYWFGSAASPTLDPRRSLADPPVFSKNNTVVRIDLRPFRWSNGESVTTRDVLFWLNLLHAEKANWAPYSIGSDTIPDNIAGATVNSATELTLTLTTSYNRFWYANSQLSQVIPLPVAWDKTSLSAGSGSGNCSAAAYGTDDSACAAVYTFLANQAGYDPNNPSGPNTALAGYATNPLWQVVDGPWRLTQIDAGGHVTMKANPSYGGPRPGNVGRFVEVPFDSAGAEQQALSNGQLTYGYLPLDAVGASTTNPQRAGPNNGDLGSYVLAPLVPWALSYFPYNFNSTGDGGWAGLLFQQLYLRQAMQLLVDQPGIVAQVAHGYGVPTNGPVPLVPANPYASANATTGPYPYDPGRAVALLSAHGWRPGDGGVETCRRPGTAANQCGGAGGTKIPAGTRLAFRLQYAAGSPTLAAAVGIERAAWSKAGIDVTTSPAPYASVLSTAASCRFGCPWELEDWGTGWLFWPWTYPLGDPIFESNAQFNAGSYADPTNDANLAAGRTSAADLSAYQSYLARQLPVLFQPNFDRLVEVSNTVRGATPPNVLFAVTPEDWIVGG